MTRPRSPRSPPCSAASRAPGPRSPPRSRWPPARCASASWTLPSATSRPTSAALRRPSRCGWRRWTGSATPGRRRASCRRRSTPTSGCRARRRPGSRPGMGAFHRARVLALIGKKQEAAQAFAELVSANPGTPAARLGQERLTGAGGGGLQGGHRARGRTRDERPALLAGAFARSSPGAPRARHRCWPTRSRGIRPPPSPSSPSTTGTRCWSLHPGVRPARVRQPRRGPDVGTGGGGDARRRAPERDHRGPGAAGPCPRPRPSSPGC